MQGIIKSSTDLQPVFMAGVINVDDSGNQRNDRTHDMTDDAGRFNLVDAVPGDRIMITHVNFHDSFITLAPEHFTGSYPIQINPQVYEVGEVVVEAEKDPWYTETWAKAMFWILGISLLVYAVKRFG